MTIYDVKDYKMALKQLLRHKKVAGRPNLTFEDMAKHCRVQKTYLSKVLNREGNLSRDQIYRAGQYLQLNTEEQSYLLLIYDLQLSEVPELKHELLREVELRQKKQNLTENNIAVHSESINLQENGSYYMNAYLPIIHMFLTIDRYAKQPDLIMKELNLDPTLFSTLLEKLNELKIIEFQSSRWFVKVDNIHLSKTSHLYNIYRTQMRQKVMERMDRLHHDQFYSFSSVFSTEEIISKKIQALFMDFLKKTQKLVESGKSEHVYQINFDMLPWGKPSR